ncbi:hypothetical protein LTR36_008063 [Oleoguttula mirabilis]|uniref:Uncharacterized protein n=1 Tax=Oleoguttula mirabilis TaxID=1507867 RepID=A0AAV9J912_9PEZI|nr:hypothetical protein LTR36_008063 [Oleoguttula mirabilis]
MDSDSDDEPLSKRMLRRARMLAPASLPQHIPDAGGALGMGNTGRAIVSASKSDRTVPVTETQPTANVVSPEDNEAQKPMSGSYRGVHASPSEWEASLNSHHHDVDEDDHSSTRLPVPNRVPRAALSADDAPTRAVDAKPRVAGSAFDVGLSYWVNPAGTGPPEIKKPAVETTDETSPALHGTALAHGDLFEQSRHDNLRQPTPHAPDIDTVAGLDGLPLADAPAVDQATSSTTATKSTRKARTVHITKAGQNPDVAYAAKQLQSEIDDMPSGSDDVFPTAMEQDEVALSESDCRYREHNEHLVKHRADVKKLLGKESHWLEDAEVLDPETPVLKD